MTDLLLHACCGPCSTVAVPVWREQGVEPVAWFANPNIQPAAELQRRRESMLRYSRAAALELILPEDGGTSPGWAEWRVEMAQTAPEERCTVCLAMRLDGAAAAAQELGLRRFSTTLTVSPYQRHDLIIQAGEAAGDRHGVVFLYLDARDRFRDGYAESRRLALYRQSYCGCAASKWEAWHQRRSRRRRTT